MSDPSAPHHDKNDQPEKALEQPQASPPPPQEPQATPDVPSSGVPKRTLISALLVVVALAAGLIGYGWWLLRPVEPDAALGPATLHEFEIMPGWGASRITQELVDEGLIRDPTLFTLWLRYQGIDRRLGEGLYDISPAMSSREIARVLAGPGRPRVARVVIPEGFRAGDTAERLAQAGFGDEETIRGLIQSPGEMAPEHLPEGAGLEGYLFPASYDLPLTYTPEEALSAMLRRFEQELDEEIEARLDELGLSVHDWVILASIVQSEAGSHSEKPIIAGVFLNRLDRGMRLEADPTVAYGLGIRLNELNRFAGHFTQEADHPWNTYTRHGLPQGPISNPGQEALQAVLSPQRVDENGNEYLFFLHTREGEFRPNLNREDHERDVQLYLR